MGRTARGVKGLNVDGSEVVGLATSRDGTHLLAVSQNGYGDVYKRQVVGYPVVCQLVLQKEIEMIEPAVVTQKRNEILFENKIKEEFNFCLLYTSTTPPILKANICIL